MDQPKKSFADDLAEVEWERLRPHLDRDALIVVDEELDIVEVANCMAVDDSGKVAEWVGTGKLKKPGRQQLEEWNGEDKKLFRTLIVQPFVLMQRLPQNA